MLSDLQTRKFTRQFKLLDANGNGRIEAGDFTRISGSLAELRGLSQDQAQELAKRYLQTWEALRETCDEDGDGEVTLEEWLAFHRKALEVDYIRRVASPRYRSPIEALARFVFDLLDANGDGQVSREEYLGFCWAHGLEDEQAERCFREIDRDGDGFLSRDEVIDMVLEFYFSDDPQVAGNWLFGPVEMEHVG